MPAILQIDGLSRSFGALRVIDGLDLTVESGEAVGIIGPNGAGKTTLFNLITGVLEPDAGTVWFDGNNITGATIATRVRRGIGRTYQVPRPFSQMTVIENLLVAADFGADLPQRMAIETCVEILETTGLIDYANRLAGGLTLLERKRLEMARAIATSPKLLMLDEVAGGLTEPEYEELIQAISTVRKSGVTVIWIEHIVKALLQVVERLIVIHGGSVLSDGEPRAVVKDPRVVEVYTGIAV